MAQREGESGVFGSERDKKRENNGEDGRRDSKVCEGGVGVCLCSLEGDWRSMCVSGVDGKEREGESGVVG